MKKLIALLLALCMMVCMVACGSNPKGNEELSETQKIILEAQNMTLEELALKAIEESNGKMFYGVGNSSRGKTALPLFIAYLQTIDPSYTMEFEWQQPKNNKIFDQLTADSLKETGTFAMTLIQDGNQIQSKMVATGILDTFIPKDWADANNTTAADYKGFLPLQTLNKVFMFNNTGDKTYDNCWDFVAEGAHGLYMDIDSEIVGKNFLYMLTHETYATWLKEAYDALSASEKAYFEPTIAAMESEAKDLGVEQRAHNNSDGDYLGFGLLERYDCRDWISWVNDKLGSEVLPIYLCGVSMGATSVLMASGLDLPVNVHGIIADCGFTSPHDIWVHVAKNNLRISSKMRSSVADRICKEKINVGSKSYSTIDALKATKIPVLFIHGSDDHFVPVRMTYENYKACVSPKRLLIVPGAEHGLSYCVDKEQYEAAVYRFWEEFDYRYEKKYFDYKRK